MPSRTHAFSVASYNVLADSFITPDWYPFIDPHVLVPAYRHTALADHIARVNTDAICLQEVEPAVHDVIRRRLHPLGYASFRAARTSRRMDGCAMFLRTATFTTSTIHQLEFQDGSGNVALIAITETFGRRVGIATVHLSWERDHAPHEPRHALGEVRSILALTVDERPACDAWIVCGDFNALPTDDVPREFVRSGYTDAFRDQPLSYTCNVNAEAKRIDYLFSSSALTPHAIDVRQINDHTPLPSRDEPSDHLLIAARYEWTTA